MKDVLDSTQLSLVMAGYTRKEDGVGVVSTPSHTYNDVDDLVVGGNGERKLYRKGFCFLFFSCFTPVYLLALVGLKASQCSHETNNFRFIIPGNICHCLGISD